MSAVASGRDRPASGGRRAAPRTPPAVRSIGACVAAGATACSLWAALDDPYKHDAVGPIDDAGDSGAGAAADAAGEAAARDAAAARRLIDAGYYALAAHGDTVYAVDDRAQVFVAYDAGTSFADFWTSDGGATFLLQTNGVAASAAGVFWTASDGVHHCAVDGGTCGVLPSTGSPRAIAASDAVVAWIDAAGVRTCGVDLATCAPATLGASKGAASVAVGPAGAVAWADGGSTVRVADPSTNAAIVLPYSVSVLATDEASGDLYWEGQSALGLMQFDGGAARTFPLTSTSKPIELFAARGVAYWSLRSANGVVSYCRFDADAGCTPTDLASPGLPTPTTNDGIVATSRNVLAVVSSDMTLFPPQLVVWRAPP